MNLLLCTIQEYLNERHPSWRAVSHFQGYIQIDMSSNFSIILSTKNMTVSWLSGAPHHGITDPLQEVAYTEHTVLSQIDEIINREAYK